MKNIAVISVLLLFICSMTVYAVDERSQTLTTLPLCDSFSVELINASSRVDAGEYSFHFCVQSDNFWTCNCSSNYPVNLYTKMNTLNTYSFRINVSYTTTSYASGSSHHSSSYYVGSAINVTQNITKPVVPIKPIVIPNTTKPVKPVVISVPPKNQTNVTREEYKTILDVQPMMWVIAIMSAGVIFGLVYGIAFLIKEGVKKKDK